MDPLSFTTGLVDLIGLTAQIVQYVEAVEGAPKAAKELQAEIVALGHVLEQLVKFLRNEAAKGNSFDETSILCSARNACQDHLHHIEKRLTAVYEGGKFSRSMQRIKWPFAENEIQQSLEALHRCTQAFQFSLTIEGW